MANFEKALARLLPWEGGYSNDPTDPGGETNYGITAMTARAFGYMGSMKDIPMDVVKAIYERLFWGPLSLDFVDSQRIAEQIFQGAVNQGVTRWAKIMQTACIGIIYGLKVDVDGAIGPKTVRAIEMILNEGLAVEYSKRLYTAQMDRYKTITIKNPKLIKYENGWKNRATDFLL